MRQYRKNLKGVCGVLGLSFAFFLLFSVVFSFSALAEVINVRGGEHDEFSRIVFDLPYRVDYSLENNGGVLDVHFFDEGEANLSAVRRADLGRVFSINQVNSGGDMVVRIETSLNARIRDFRDGSKVVIDVYGGGERAESGVNEPIEDDAALPVSAEEMTANIRHRRGEILISGDGGNNISSLEEQLQAIRGFGSDTANSRNEDRGGNEEVDRNEEAPELSPSVPYYNSSDSDNERLVSRAMPTESEALYEDVPSLIKIDLPLGEGEDKIAVFRRGGWLWLVTDNEENYAEPRITGPARVELENSGGEVDALHGRAFHWAIPDGVFVDISRISSIWVITLSLHDMSEDIIAPAHDIFVDGEEHEVNDDVELGGENAEVEVVDEGLRGSLVPDIGGDPPETVFIVSFNGSGNLVAFTDPIIGDRLAAIPSNYEGAGISVDMNYPEFDILEAMQGVVIRPLSDQLSFSTRQTGRSVLIKAENGLNLISSQDFELIDYYVALVEQENRYFDNLAAWRGRLPVREQNVNLGLEAAMTAPDDYYSRAFEQARLNFSHDLPYDAFGYLELALRADPLLMHQEEYLGLRGAVLAMINRPGQALDILNDATLAEYHDLAAWRGLAYARLGEWMSAYQGFKEAGESLFDLPDEIFNRLGLVAAESALFAGDLEMLERVLVELEDRREGVFVDAGALNYLYGELAFEEGNLEGAIGLWSALEDSPNELYRARALFRRTILELENDMIDRDEAIEELKYLRFAWRGDRLEYDILRELGQLYLDNDDYIEGLGLLRSAISYFPGSAEAGILSAKMREVFHELFVEGKADELSPSDVVAIYFEFQELSPHGEEGDIVAENLARRMADLDLLEDAANIYEDLALHRYHDADAAKAGANAAALHILRGYPDKALDILTATQTRVASLELREERLLLEAKAMADNGRPHEALSLLSLGSGMEVEKARADIAWKAGLWGEAADSLSHLIVEPPAEGADKLSDDDAELVLNLAVALALDGDRLALGRLNDNYSHFMIGTSSYDNFRLISRSRGEDLMQDVATVRRQMDEISLYETFLEGYRGSNTNPNNNG